MKFLEIAQKKAENLIGKSKMKGVKPDLMATMHNGKVIALFVTYQDFSEHGESLTATSSRLEVTQFIARLTKYLKGA